MLGKPHPEQGQIGERLRVTRPKLPGWLLETVGDGGPRGMIIAPGRVTAPGNRTRLMAFSSHFIFGKNGTKPLAVPFFFISDHDVTNVQDQQHSQPLWRGYLAKIKQEYQALDLLEQHWIVDRIGRIAELQKQLNNLFVAAGGLFACRQCSGACCDCGKNHFTLANMLTFVCAGLEPPEPDFSQPCPFLGALGCRLEVFQRPFNCITFICEQVLEPLGKEGEEKFLRLEKELRSHYLAFDRRYAGSSLCGLFIRAERLAGRPFLAHI